MTVEEAAKYLFVSCAHINMLLAHGKLMEVLPRNPSGLFDIDLASVQEYRARRDAGGASVAGFTDRRKRPAGMLRAYRHRVFDIDLTISMAARREAGAPRRTNQTP